MKVQAALAGHTEIPRIDPRRCRPRVLPRRATRCGGRQGIGAAWRPVNSRIDLWVEACSRATWPAGLCAPGSRVSLAPVVSSARSRTASRSSRSPPPVAGRCRAGPRPARLGRVRCWPEVDLALILVAVEADPARRRRRGWRLDGAALLARVRASLGVTDDQARAAHPGVDRAAGRSRLADPPAARATFRSSPTCRAWAFVRLDVDSRSRLRERPGARAPRPRAGLACVGQTAIEGFIDRRIEDDQRSGAARGVRERRVHVPARPTARRLRRPGATVGDVAACGSSSRTSRSCGCSSGSEPSSSRTCPTSFGRRCRPSASCRDAGARSRPDDDAVPPRMRERIGKIEVETGHLVQMVNELLDLTRIEQRRPDSSWRTDVDLGARRARVGRTPDALRRTAGRGVARRRRRAICHAVRGDEDRLGQVLVNLAPQRREVQPGRRRRHESASASTATTS